MRFDEWKPTQNSFLPALNLTPILCKKIAIQNTKATEPKKLVEKKNHLQIIIILKKVVDTTTIMKRILDLEVNLTFGRLFASTQVVEKQLTKIISDNKAVQFWLNSLESNIVKAKKSHFWYFIIFLKAKIRIKNRSKLTVLLDTDAKINIMTQKVMKDVGLTK